MCEFCIKHGEGKKWYENMTNYSREVFLQVNSEERVKKFLKGFARSMRKEVRRAEKWKKRIPYIYNCLIYPLFTRRQKKTHFGQIVPIEDIENILKKVSSIIRLPCICRKVNTGEEKRVCYAVGMDVSHILKELPDFSNFDHISASVATKEMRHLDKKGLTHSVWTFQTPFIGAVCNCDRDCMAYRIQHRKKLAKVMWRGEYIADIDLDRCKGCRLCMNQCMFDAVHLNRQLEKCRIDAFKCYGCGICREACPENAIFLVERNRCAQAKKLW
ncbi:MAG: 4Fe-4S binding protein [Desulfobulbaceae bacterium]|nr:4Fe-4S binding protein [Desulfobulbaceae bacterium]